MKVNEEITAKKENLRKVYQEYRKKLKTLNDRNN